MLWATTNGKETRQKLLPGRELDYLAIETIVFTNCPLDPIHPILLNMAIAD
ncbi:hypothetical protein PGT21_005325 [Puccinia graminis f. sp. tritici]|uniref:Uncharacterized protein n=1 Tax=Puccinia graminis f. sp. tritici TaxID=56615 RepID=A0A5B0MW29_PUCGR|nr:hypothetical protein PGT21_005325 [Puccinia graminis f. sp. tritici]KAA1080040.1 hypothetical protein PGTUg99_023930 [Puccinia graminis f. sp. tritici]